MNDYRISFQWKERSGLFKVIVSAPSKKEALVAASSKIADLAYEADSELSRIEHLNNITIKNVELLT